MKLRSFFLLGFWLLGLTQASQATPRCFLVMVGVSDYAPGAKIPALRFAARDARELGQALRLGAQTRFGSENVRFFLLTGERQPPAEENGHQMATKTNLHTVFEAVGREAREEDTVLAFFAGHGVPLGENDYAFLTQDAGTADLQNSPFRADWSVSGQELRLWLQKIAARRRALILDTCAAGAFVETGQTARPGRVAWDQGALGTDISFPVLMGCAADASSQESPRFGHGLVSYALLEGLHGPALTGSNLGVKKWLHGAVKRVGELAAEVRDAQEPRLLWPNRGEDFVVGRLENAQIAALGPLKRVPLVVEPRLSTRDDPGNAFEVELERRLLALLRESEKRGELQLLPRDQSTQWPDVPMASALLERSDGVVKIAVVIREGATRRRVSLGGRETEMEELAKRLAALVREVTTADGAR